MHYKTSIVRPIVLTFLMAIPFGFGVGFLAVGISEGWREYKREVLEIRTSASWQRRTLSFLADGEPIIYAWPRSHGYTRLDGSPLADEEEQDVIQEQRLSHGPGSRRRRPFDRAPFEELLLRIKSRLVVLDPENRAIRWKWEVDPEVARGSLLIARHSSSGKPLTYVSPEGFSASPPQSRRGFELPEDTRESAELVAFRSAGNLVAIDLLKKTVATIAEVNPAETAWEMFQQNDETGWRFATRDASTLNVYTATGERLFEFPVPDSVTRKPELYTTRDGAFIVTWYQDRRTEQLPGGGSMDRYARIAKWLDANGNETRQLEFEDEFSRLPPKSDPPVVAAIDWFIERIGPGLLVPSPAAVCGAFFVFVPKMKSYDFPGQSSHDLIQEVLQEVPYAIPVSALVGLLCAIACWRRQFRYQAEWTKTWTIFVFLFGFPVWIAWRVHRRWPPLELVTAADADFVGPELNGLEIR
jgi:hypothetical protein